MVYMIQPNLIVGDVCDSGVAHINNKFKIPTLNVFNRETLNSIIFRCGRHLTRDKNVTSGVDAI